MPRWTTDQLNAYEARHAPKRWATQEVPCDDESELQDAIHAECNRRGWLANRSRMDRATTTMLGTPDFWVLATDGRLFMFECKSGKKKRTPEQMGYAAWCDRLGHKVWLIRSLKEFLDIVNQSK